MGEAKPFETLADVARQIADLPGPDQAALSGAKERQGVLTKPPGALGRLEDLAIWYAGWRGTARPVICQPQVVVFAGNHGVTAQGISAFPSEVTVQMVANFRAGGAAINQLARDAGARFSVVELDLDRPTADFTEAPAMTEAECVDALHVGWASVEAETDLFVAGEMGIGNTTSAAAIAAALFGGGGAEWAGRGTGLDDAGVGRKAEVIDRALARHLPAAPLDMLARLGGREIAAMTGAILKARVARIPVILDGFIATAAASVLHAADPGALAHCVAGHASAEGAHRALLQKIGQDPLLDLGLRLGEGTGAALAIHILRAAIATHSGMATFAEAGVSDG